ncbi:MAG: hypothetical protein EBX37_00630, partial [Alphaproteobacteria bacterium]|nr:hypothetical protein [Alphaproteobacteria bacterium]
RWKGGPFWTPMGGPFWAPIDSPPLVQRIHPSAQFLERLDQQPHQFLVLRRHAVLTAFRADRKRSPEAPPGFWGSEYSGPAGSKKIRRALDLD